MTLSTRTEAKKGSVVEDTGSECIIGGKNEKDFWFKGCNVILNLPYDHLSGTMQGRQKISILLQHKPSRNRATLSHDYIP